MFLLTVTKPQNAAQVIDSTVAGFKKHQSPYERRLVLADTMEAWSFVLELEGFSISFKPHQVLSLWDNLRDYYFERYLNNDVLVSKGQVAIRCQKEGYLTDRSKLIIYFRRGKAVGELRVEYCNLEFVQEIGRTEVDRVVAQIEAIFRMT